jgi:hypothetical protein
MSQNEEPEESLVDEAGSFGLSPARFGAGSSGFARFEIGQPSVVGTCSPVGSHLALIGATQWRQGTAVFMRAEPPRLVLWEQFFCLETTDLPKDLLQLRDHFDYTLQREIQERFAEVSPILGPSWRYLFPCEDFVENIRVSVLNVSLPLMGNALNIRAESLSELLAAKESIRAYLAEKLPIPIVWAFPEGLPVAATDNFYDRTSATWYLAKIRADYEGDLSIIDLRLDETGGCNLMQHDFHGNIRNVAVDMNKIVVQFTEVDGHFKTRRKLSRLKVKHLW